LQKRERKGKRGLLLEKTAFGVFAFWLPLTGLLLFTFLVDSLKIHLFRK
jgi:hypothetical protein